MVFYCHYSDESKGMAYESIQELFGRDNRLEIKKNNIDCRDADSLFEELSAISRDYQIECCKQQIQSLQDKIENADKCIEIYHVTFEVPVEEEIPDEKIREFTDLLQSYLDAEKTKYFMASYRDTSCNDIFIEFFSGYPLILRNDKDSDEADTTIVKKTKELFGKDAEVYYTSLYYHAAKLKYKDREQILEIRNYYKNHEKIKMIEN